MSQPEEESSGASDSDTGSVESGSTGSTDDTGESYTDHSDDNDSSPSPKISKASKTSAPSNSQIAKSSISKAVSGHNDDTDNAEEFHSDDGAVSKSGANVDDDDESGSTVTDSDDDSDDHTSSITRSRSHRLPREHSDDETGSTDSGSTGSTDSESMDDEEDPEPQLKYQRVGGGLTQMMETDKASCLKCHPRFLVLGMASGTVFVLDPHGDIIKNYKAHSKTAVKDISIDQNGDYVATCSRDGRVVIRDIFKDVQNVHNFRNHQLLSLELHPNYGQQQMFVTGGRGQQLLLRSIGFFRSDNKVLHSGEGPIYCISWQRELIAWANDRGVKIYDISDHKPIAHINRSNRGSPDPERYQCCLCWENRETLLIGWGDWVKIGRIRTVRTQQGHTMKEVHVTHVFITDFYICGIAPFKEDLILLAFLENGDDSSSEEESESEDSEEHKGQAMDAGIGKSKPPELRIVSRRGEWIATDALPIHKYKANQARDYRLVWSHDDILTNRASKDNSLGFDPWSQALWSEANSGVSQSKQNESSRRRSIVDQTFYIVSPSDIVASLPRTVEDHIKWLLERAEYEKAWRQSVLHEEDLIRSKLSPTTLGEEFLMFVLEKNHKSLHRFGMLLSEVCLKDKALWEKWIDLLAERGKLKLVLEYIPRESPILQQKSYELVLQELIKNDHHTFLECVQSWDPVLYDTRTILGDATNRLNEVRQSDPLIQALAELYRMDDQFDRALEYYLQLKQQILVQLPHRYEIVVIMKETEDFQYLNNDTIEAMMREDEERKREEKLQALKDKKQKEEERRQRESISFLLPQNQHLAVGNGHDDVNGNEDHLYEDAQAERERTKIHTAELKKIGDGVFSMIMRHKLWQQIQDKIISLLELDIFRSVKLLLEHRDDIHPKGANFIIEQVMLRISEIEQQTKNRTRSRHGSNNSGTGRPIHARDRAASLMKNVSPSVYKQYLRFFSFLYLDELLGKGDGSQYPEFHDYLVALYAEFDTRQLYNFLSLSHHVKFSKALKVCEKRLANTTDEVVTKNLNECYVFILNRMGNFSEALQVILIKLKDVEKAVKFVEQQSDKSLWNNLIDRTLYDAQTLMPKLLDAVKGHPNVDAQELIRKIPDKLEIKGLRQKIIAIFEEYSREQILTKGTTRILESDCLKLSTKLYQQAARGIMVNNATSDNMQDTALCMVCRLPLRVYPSYYKEHMARLQKMEELQKLQRESLDAKKRQQTMQQQSGLNPLRNISAFGRIAIPGKRSSIGNGVNSMSNGMGNGVNGKEDGNGMGKEEEEDDSNEIGATRLNVVPKSKNPFDDDTPLWKWSELSETMPSIKVFHCGHFYHNDCYRDAQYEPKYNIAFDDGNKCLICFSGQRRKTNRR